MSSNTSLLTLSTVAVASAAIAYYFYQNHKNKKENGVTTSSPSTTKSVPLVDLNTYFNRENDLPAYYRECQKAANALQEFGLVCVRDPRVSEADNDRFLSQMERYFEQSDGITDARPQYSYQVGVTGELIEKPRDHSKLIASFNEKNRPLSASNPTYDPKWRFFWRIGPTPEKTEFPIQNMDPVLPQGFPMWKETMDMWGYKMLDAVTIIAEMTAIGFQMPKDTFTSRMKCGPHLLAPTGSNFNKYNKVGTVLAGFHYDLNFLTIHGKSRFPGLFVWTREGNKIPVSVPDGCLLVQV
jgi:isopenicillin N synthase-like dioxygenase